MQKLDLSAPWYIYRSKLAALFELDDSVSVGAIENDNEKGPSVTLKVESHAKADALRKVLPLNVNFGNVDLGIIIQDTAADDANEADILRAAFAGNRLVRRVEETTDFTQTKHVFLVMEPSVTQFFADNLADYRRNVSQLAEETARDVLSLENAAICTADLTEN